MKMNRREIKEESRRRILSACVRLFIEKGYKKTTLSDIQKDADVTPSTFYNIYRSKSGVLSELIGFMFDNQFGIARNITGEEASPVRLYALETSIQLSLAELSDNLREIYVEAYTDSEMVDLIHSRTAPVLQGIFAPYMADCAESDFYEYEIGTAGLMRAYMARPCDQYFTLEKKLGRFLTMSLAVFRVPDGEIRDMTRYISGLDIRTIADNVMQKLFAALEMRFDFALTDKEAIT